MMCIRLSLWTDFALSWMDVASSGKALLVEKVVKSAVPIYVIGLREFPSLETGFLHPNHVCCVIKLHT